MVIVKVGIKSLGRDHKRIILDFGVCASLNKEAAVLGERTLNGRKIENIAKNIESKIEGYNSDAWDYDELINVKQREIEKEKDKNTWKGNIKPRSSWNSEIKDAIEERKKTSREHRETKRLGLLDDGVALKWNRYLEKYCKCKTWYR